MRKFILGAAILLGLLALPGTASALKFSPSPDSPVVQAPVSVDDQTVLPVSYTPYDIAAADFNGDGRDDIAISSDGNRNIYIYLGEADGGLTPSATNPIGSNSPNVNSRFMLEAVDIDNDGDQDLVAGNTLTPTVIETFLNDRIDGPATNAHETFGTVPDSTLNLGDSNLAAYYLSASFGDKDDDGDTDMVLGLYDHELVYIRNDEGVLVAPEGPVQVGSIGEAQDWDGIISTAMGDFDGNGAGGNDLVMISNPNYEETGQRPDRLLYAESDGPDGYQSSPVTLLQTEPGDYLHDVQTIDLNGDDYDDIVFKQTVQNEQTTRTALGSANGPVLQDDPGTSVEVYGASPVSIGDYNDDGNQDLALPQFVDEGFEVALGDGGGQINLDPAGPFAIPAIGSVEFYPQKSAAGDVNGDGRLDFIAASGNPGANQAPGVAIMLNEPASGIAVNLTSIDFGEVPFDAELIAPAPVTIESNGDLPLNLRDISFSGPATDGFLLDRGNCPTGNLAAGSSCTLEVAMKQSQPGYFNGFLDITNDATAEPIQIEVIGQVEEPEPTSKFLSLKVKSAKKVKAAKRLVVTAVVRNSGDYRSAKFDLRASAPKKLTGKIKFTPLRNLSISERHASTIKFQVPVKRRAQGKLQVKISLVASDRTIERRTAKVKIIKAKKKRKR